MPTWQIASGTKWRKTNKVIQDNNSTESSITTNRYDANEEETADVNTTKWFPDLHPYSYTTS
jgi:hypothetical protein